MRRQSSESGMTLVEVSISAALFSLIAGVTLYTLMVCQDFQARAAITDNLRGQAESALDSIIETFQDVNEGSIITPTLDPMTIPGRVTEIRYKKVLRVDKDGNRIHTPDPNSTDPNRVSEFSFGSELAAGELDDGKDNNGNGLIDERQIVSREHFLNGATISRIISPNVKKTYDLHGNIIPGFYMEFAVDDPVNPIRWLVRVSIVLEKRNPKSRTETGTTIVHYKTATIELAE